MTKMMEEDGGKGMQVKDDGQLLGAGKALRACRKEHSPADTLILTH